MKVILIISFLCKISVSCLAQESSKSKYILIKGIQIAYKTHGLSSRTNGQPVLVFEAGLGASKETFNKIIEQFPDSVCWLSYDRPNIFESAVDSSLMTDRDIVSRLHDLLKHLEIAPPYILVGHSLGGIYCRLYVATYPEDVSGLILIDPTHFMLTKTQDLQIKKASNNKMGVAEYLSYLLKKFSKDTTIPVGVRFEMKRAVKNYSEPYFREYKFLTPLPNIPVTILIAFRSPIDEYERKMFSSLGIKGDAFYNQLNKFRIQDYTSLIESNENSQIVLLPNYPHYIHFKDPKRVALLILETVEQTRKNK